MSVLKLSHLFGMQVLQSLAMSKITKLPTTKEEWVSVLNFSITISNLPIPEIRQAALDAISLRFTDPVETVLLARRYKVKKWLIEGYSTLVRRNQIISMDEECSLGVEATYHLLHMRDRSNWTSCKCDSAYSKRKGHYIFRGPPTYQRSLDADICSRFAQEIEDVDDLASLPFPEPDPLIHLPENGITRDSVFYFATETIQVSDVRLRAEKNWLTKFR
jgi:hypothetical protein